MEYINYPCVYGMEHNYQFHANETATWAAGGTADEQPPDLPPPREIHKCIYCGREQRKERMGG